MTLEIYAASAGTGKTTKLAELMEGALLGKGVPRCRPEGIVATTFTRKAAAELRERARTQLLSNRHVEAAQALNAAMIGTVNSVCGRIVSDFALELGLSVCGRGSPMRPFVFETLCRGSRVPCARRTSVSCAAPMASAKPQLPPWLRC